MPNFPILEESKIIVDVLNAFLNGLDDAEAREEAERRFFEELGEEDGNYIYGTCGAMSNIGSVMLCRDCIVFDNDDYFNKLFEVYDYGWSMQEMRTRAKSLLEKCKQIAPAMLPQFREALTRAEAATRWLDREDVESNGMIDKQLS